MKKAKRVLCFTVLAAPFLLAMGFLGDPPALERAPLLDTRLDAVVQDTGGMTTRVTYVSHDGALYLPVYRGKALITIPLQKISRIDFGPQKGTTRRITVSFTDGREESFDMDAKVLFVGKLPFGTYQIQAKDMASITFVEPGSDPGEPVPQAPGDPHSG